MKKKATRLSKRTITCGIATFVLYACMLPDLQMRLDSPERECFFEALDTPSILCPPPGNPDGFPDTVRKERGTMAKPKDEASLLNAARETVAAIRDEVREIADTILDQISRGEDYSSEIPTVYTYKVTAAERTVTFQAKNAVAHAIYAALKTNSALREAGVTVTRG